MFENLAKFCLLMGTCDALLLIFAVLAIRFGRRMRAFGRTIAETGIAPAKGGLFGLPEKDTKTSTRVGSFFYIMSLCWDAAGCLLILAMVVLTGLVFIRVF